MAANDATEQAATKAFSSTMHTTTAASFAATTPARLTGWVSRNSAVCSDSSLDSMRTPRYAAKNAPPMPSTAPHSTPKNPRGSPMLSWSMPNASVNTPKLANMAVKSSDWALMSGNMATHSTTMPPITTLQTASIFAFWRISCKKTVMLPPSRTPAAWTPRPLPRPCLHPLRPCRNA